MLLFYVRHGDPIYNPDSLTEQGHLQAQALVERMKVCKPERIFASSSNRAQLTAKPTAEALGLPIETLDWCHEHKTWEDFATPREDGAIKWYCHIPKYIELFNTDEIYALGENWWQHPAFRDTRVKQGLDRIRRETDAFLEDLGYIREGNGYIVKNPTHKRVALFAHQGFGWAFLSGLLRIPYPMFSTRFDMGHSGVSVIHFADEGYTIPKLLQLSNDSHIFACDELKTNYQNVWEF